MDFMESYELASTAEGWSNERKARQLWKYLTGAARIFWSELPNRLDWEAVQPVMYEHFVPPEVSRFHNELLLYRYQKPGESLAEYAADIGKLVRNANPTFGDVERQELMRQHFLRGLLPEIALHVCQTAPGSSYAQAYRLAQNFESGRKILQHTAATIALQAQGNKATDPQVFAGFAVSPARGGLQGQPTRQPQYPSYSNPRYNQPRQNFPPPRRQSRPLPAPPPRCALPTRCFNCNREGHISRDCRARREYYPSQQSYETPTRYVYDSHHNARPPPPNYSRNPPHAPPPMQNNRGNLRGRPNFRENHNPRPVNLMYYAPPGAEIYDQEPPIYMGELPQEVVYGSPDVREGESADPDYDNPEYGNQDYSNPAYGEYENFPYEEEYSNVAYEEEYSNVAYEEEYSNEAYEKGYSNEVYEEESANLYDQENTYEPDEEPLVAVLPYDRTPTIAVIKTPKQVVTPERGKTTDPKGQVAEKPGQKQSTTIQMYPLPINSATIFFISTFFIIFQNNPAGGNFHAKDISLCPTSLGTIAYDFPRPGVQRKFPNMSQVSRIQQSTVNRYYVGLTHSRVNASHCVCETTEWKQIYGFSGKHGYIMHNSRLTPLTELECLRMLQWREFPQGKVICNGQSYFFLHLLWHLALRHLRSLMQTNDGIAFTSDVAVFHRRCLRRPPENYELLLPYLKDFAHVGKSDWQPILTNIKFREVQKLETAVFPKWGSNTIGWQHVWLFMVCGYVSLAIICLHCCTSLKWTNKALPPWRWGHDWLKLIVKTTWEKFQNYRRTPRQESYVLSISRGQSSRPTSGATSPRIPLKTLGWKSNCHHPNIPTSSKDPYAPFATSAEVYTLKEENPVCPIVPNRETTPPLSAVFPIKINGKR
ncbi:MAG: hypothetical protein GY696_27105 [Gammaproteobacteria bacterium]|nr:hypothetical protein [Gammaproteobacteria bacterium]